MYVPSDVQDIRLSNNVNEPELAGSSPNNCSTNCLDNCAKIRDSKFLINLARVVFAASLSAASFKACISAS